VNYDTLNRKLEGLDEDIMAHANLASVRERVDDDDGTALSIVAAYTTGLASATERDKDTEALDFVEQVQQEAIQSYRGQYDMEDVEDMFSSVDFDEFADHADEKLDVDEEAAAEFKKRFSDESLAAGRPTTIEEALSIPIREARDAFETGNPMDTIVDDSMEMFTRSVTELSENIRERMETEKEKL
jgi:hypothetical protein